MKSICIELRDPEVTLNYNEDEVEDVEFSEGFVVIKYLDRTSDVYPFSRLVSARTSLRT